MISVSINFSPLISHLVTHHFSLFTVRCKYQLTRLTRLSLLDETFSIDEIVAVDEADEGGRFNAENAPDAEEILPANHTNTRKV